jgi:hypothetical protein
MSPCPECDRPVVLALAVDEQGGMALALDPVALCYFIEFRAGGRRHATRALTPMVAHAATCRARPRDPAPQLERSAQGYETAPCRACRAPVVFAESDRGAKLPLDAAAAVYLVERAEGELRARRTHVALVTHFATCPEAARFSKGRQ